MFSMHRTVECPSFASICLLKVMLLLQFVELACLSQPLNFADEGKERQREMSTSVRNDEESLWLLSLMCLHGFVLHECPSISKMCIHVLYTCVQHAFLLNDL